MSRKKLLVQSLKYGFTARENILVMSWNHKVSVWRPFRSSRTDFNESSCLCFYVLCIRHIESRGVPKTFDLFTTEYCIVFGLIALSLWLSLVGCNYQPSVTATSIYATFLSSPRIKHSCFLVWKWSCDEWSVFLHCLSVVCVYLYLSRTRTWLEETETEVRELRGRCTHHSLLYIDLREKERKKTRRSPLWCFFNHHATRFVRYFVAWCWALHRWRPFEWLISWYRNIGREYSLNKGLFTQNPYMYVGRFLFGDSRSNKCFVVVVVFWFIYRMNVGFSDKLLPFSSYLTFTEHLSDSTSMPWLS